MSFALRASVSLLLISVAPLAVAQTESRAYIFSNPSSTGCSVTSPDAPVSAAACPVTPVAGGIGSSSASADASARTARAEATATQTVVAMGPRQWLDAIGRTATLRSLLINGTANAGDSLVFHFQVTDVVAVLTGQTNNRSYADYFVEVEANGYLSYHDVLVQECCVNVQRQTSTYSPGFVHLSIGIGGVSNVSLDYIYRVFAEAAIEDDVFGATSEASIEAFLASIDARDSNGNVRGSAVFDAEGNGTLDLAGVVVPEPATLPLLATGLLTIAGIARGRRRRAA